MSAGTIFDKTRTPLTAWFAAAWYVTNQKQRGERPGAEARARAGELPDGLDHPAQAPEERWCARTGTGWQATWKRTRPTSVAPSRASEAVRPARSRSWPSPWEIHQPKGFGRARLRRIPDVSGRSLVSFIREAVESGSVVHTDGWRGYNGLPDAGYTRKKTVLSDSGDPAHVSMPAVHRVASLLKRWLLGTHQGSVGPEQLDSYLDEFTFRFNRRTSRSRGLLFYRLLEQAVITDPATYAVITRRA